LLGTVGLGAVLLRNVLERRQELALMRALGYQRRDFLLMSMAESLALLVLGLLTGAASAFLATAPVIWDRGGQLPGTLVLGLLGGVLIVGLIASLSATVTALRSPLLPALREE
jgi:ABC-type antimicrobial peptide transport system permease subunit